MCICICYICVFPSRFCLLLVCFAVTASSSDLSTVGSTFLQLKLQIDRGSGAKEDVLMELTLPQFYQFLSQMHTAARQVQNLSK